MDNSLIIYTQSPSRTNRVPKIGSKSFWMAFCLTFPLVARVLFPSSFEVLLEVQVFGVPVFLPTILLFLFLIGSIPNRENKGLKLIFWLQIVFMLIGFFYNHYSQNPIAMLLAGNYYYYIVLIGLYCRLNMQERYWVLRFYTVTLMILGFEVILLGLGIVKGFGAKVVADDAQSFGDFFRASTTAGSATGTAAHLYLLTAICILLASNIRWRYFLFVFGFSTTILTVTRGASLAFMMYLLLYFIFKKKKKNGHRIKIIFVSIAALSLLYAIGVFKPLLERMTIKSQDETMLESREDRAATALIYYQMADSKLLGVGIANLYRSTEIHHIGIENEAAPHNSYIQTLCEQGIIGLVLFVLFWVVFVFLNRNNKAILIPMIPLLLVIWNTESSVVSLTDFVISIAILLMLALDKGRLSQLNTL